MKKTVLLSIGILGFALGISHLSAAPLVIDDFNVSAGHFTWDPTGSGSTAGVLATSTTRRVTEDPREGTGCLRLVLNTNGVIPLRIRLVSGGGSAANNTTIPTSPDVDGWIGFYARTTNTGWDVQLWLAGPLINGSLRHNGSTQKELIADGEWHLYEWNLDDNSGGEDGWGNIPNIITGFSEVLDGNHYINSIIFRNAESEDATAVIDVDFVAQNTEGSVADLLDDPCRNVSGVLPIGPISSDVNEVTIVGATASTSAITVYQNSGPNGSMVAVGSKTSDIVEGNNAVTVSGLQKGGIVAATQTVNGQESCVPTIGLFVGGGANPSIRAALSIRETSSEGPVGSPGISTSANLHFLGTASVQAGAPINAPIIYPSNDWQTVTFNRGSGATVGDATGLVASTTSESGYNPTDIVELQVYAYRTLPNGNIIYSETPAQSDVVTSNDVFAVNWAWNAVPGADGYRLLRSYWYGGFYEYVDVTDTQYHDQNNNWIYDPNETVDAIAIKTAQAGASIQWNPTASNTNNLPGDWGILEAIGFIIDDPGDTGPFDLYIDDLKNGDTVFQTFETAPSGSTDYGFRAPSFSGTTSGSLLTTPNVGQVSNLAANTGSKSFHARFQWKGTNSTTWLRLTTSGVNNPQVNLNEPISFRLLMQPVGATPPTPPAAPELSITETDAGVVLNWEGGHRLQSATTASGPYANVPQNNSPNVWTNITSGAFLGPWTNSYTEPARFFRLAD